MVASALLAACGAPSLELDVRHDDPALSERVAHFELEVYQPDDAAYDCDDLAFGLVTPLPQQSGSFEGSAPDLGSIRRVGTKLFVVRGLNAGGTAVVAGCASVGTIETTTTVEIALAPVTIVTVEGGSFGLTVDRERDFERWYVEVQDRLDRPVPNADVRWEAFGAGMTSARVGTEVKRTEVNGRVVRFVELSDPRPGPLEVTVRSRWGARESVALAFVPPTEEALTIPIGEVDPVVFEGGVALGVRGANETSVTVVGADTSTIAGRWRLGQASTRAFLLSDAERRPLYDDGSIGAAAPATNSGAPQWILDLSPCGGGAPFFAVGFAVGPVAFDTSWAPNAIEDLGEAPRSGCVDDRRIVFAPDRAALWVSDDELVPLPFDPRIVDLGFGGQWSDAPDVALTTVAEGRSIALAVRPRVTTNDGLLTEPPLPITGTPEAVELGDVDGNGTWEVITLSRVSTDEHALFVVVTAGGRSVSAGLVLEQRYERPWLAAVDVDDDGVVEIVVVDTARGGAVTVFSME
ncbi:MAG: hypothetical protein RIT81_21310 [Deltaproteobacteria bacterium]